jgi:acyl-CoA-dependent ceramide synthase
MNLLILLGLSHAAFPSARRHTRKFFELSYYNQESDEYALGGDDLFIVLCWVALFTGLRAGIMDFIFVPFGRWRGIKNTKVLTRFAEQAWLFIYCSIFWSLGMVSSLTSLDNFQSDEIIVYHVPV